MARWIEHVRGLWGRLWFLPLTVAAYAVVIFAIGDLRPEHVVFAVGTAALGYWGPRSKRFLIDIAPYIGVAVLYDIVRYLRPLFVTPERVIGCGLRELELALFAVAPGVTAQDWLATCSAPVLDLLFAVPYTVFVYVAFVYAAYLYFVDRPRMRHYLWSYAIANSISFFMWLAVPAAPPWYVRAHGCAIDVGTLPDPAGLSRVDALLGITYFHDFYSRAASVFGALPSMHCAYPLIGLLTAWRAATPRTMAIHVAYTALMFAASVYLDHHWIIDGLLGWAVALVAVRAAAALVSRLYPVPAPSAVAVRSVDG